MGDKGYLVGSQATVRVHSMATGAPFPSTSVTNWPSLMVTASKSNAGTVFLKFNTNALAGITCTAAGRGATIKNKTMVPLLAGESISFTGMGVGSDTPRSITFGTGYSYVFGSATSQTIVCTGLKQS